MIRRIILSVIVGVVVTLLSLLLGSILVPLNLGVLVTIGNFLKEWAGLLGVLAAVWYFLSGANWTGRA